MSGYYQTHGIASLAAASRTLTYQLWPVYTGTVAQPKGWYQSVVPEALVDVSCSRLPAKAADRRPRRLRWPLWLDKQFSSVEDALLPIYMLWTVGLLQGKVEAWG